MKLEVVILRDVCGWALLIFYIKENWGWDLLCFKQRRVGFTCFTEEVLGWEFPFSKEKRDD